MSLSDKWETLSIKTTPRIGETIVDYCVIPKSNFENNIGTIIIQADNGYIRRLRVSIIPKRTPKNGSHIIDIKQTNSTVVAYVSGMYYISPEFGDHIMYATHTGHMHLFPEVRLLCGSKITGSVQATATGYPVINPRMVNPSDSFVMIKESGSIHIGTLKTVTKRSPGQAPDKVWTKARRLTDPIIFLGQCPTIGIFATSTEGDLELVTIKRGVLPEGFEQIKRVSAILVI
jgi:hypothetical protein